MQSKEKISLIIKIAGGDSLARIIATNEYNGATFAVKVIAQNLAAFCRITTKGLISVCDWQLLKDNQEAKLQDQTPETIEAIHKLISGSDEDNKLSRNV